MEVAGKCVLCEASIPLKPDESLRIVCDKCKAKQTEQEESCDTSNLD